MKVDRTERTESSLLFEVDSHKILHGELISHKTLIFDKAILDDASVTNVMAVRDGEKTYIIDKDTHQAVSGTYLVDMDGLLSLNEIQRLLGKKLVISFNGSILTVDEDDVRVVGRVALVMEKK